MRDDRLGIFDGTTILEVGGDAGRAESVATGGVGKSCGLSTPRHLPCSLYLGLLLDMMRASFARASSMLGICSIVTLDPGT